MNSPPPAVPLEDVFQGALMHELKTQFQAAGIDLNKADPSHIVEIAEALSVKKNSHFMALAARLSLSAGPSATHNPAAMIRETIKMAVAEVVGPYLQNRRREIMLADPSTAPFQ